MSKFIFTKNSGGQGLYRIARDQSFMDANKNHIDEDYDILDVTTEEFNDFKKGLKKVVSHDNSTVTFETISYSLDAGPLGNIPKSFYETEVELKEDIKNIINQCNEYLLYNSGKPLESIINTYVTYLEQLDTSNLTPLNKTIEKYADEQGQDPVHLLELI